MTYRQTDRHKKGSDRHSEKNYGNKYLWTDRQKFVATNTSINKCGHSDKNKCGLMDNCKYGPKGKYKYRHYDKDQNIC